MRKNKEAKKLEIGKINFYYGHGLEVNYSRSDCVCRDEDYFDYCRCTSIINEEITSIDFDRVLHTLTEEINSVYKTTNLQDYCLDRIFTKAKLYDASAYEIRLSPGYYGEELDGVYISVSWLQNAIDEFLKLNSESKQVEYVLNLEYGYLLDSIKNCNWSVQTIEKHNVSLNDEYKKLTERVDRYAGKNFSGPRGVYLKIPGTNKYRIIDGYHRYITAPNHYEAIVGEKQQ